MSKISKIKAFQILDSRGLPTIATKVYLDDGRFALASVPSGASTGQKEALELRDGEKEFGGKGVNIAIKNVNNVLAKLLEGKNVYNFFTYLITYTITVSSLQRTLKFQLTKLLDQK